MELKRVVVTGLGAITPIGNNFSEYWESLINGVSGASPITLFDSKEFKTTFACEVKNFNAENHFDRKEARKMDRCAQLGMVSAREAISHSKILEANPNKNRIGVIWGSGIGGIMSFEHEVSSHARGNGIPRYSPYFIPKMIADITPGLISIEYGFRGPNYATVSACASSSNAIIDAMNLIRLGKADAIITGGSEAAVCEACVGGFNSLQALSTRNDDPTKASRPFDKNRDGFVLGEGSGCFVLEEYEHAIAREATIYAELAGGGLSADAYHMTAPHPEGIGVIAVMNNTLEDSNVTIDQIDHINTHGTSTPLGDFAETKAIAQLFGDNVKNIPINSTKSMTGHLLGAAGIVESLAVIGTIMHGIIPPTINHLTIDETIDPRLNLTLNKAQQKVVNIAMSNTFGFGGHNACVLFKKI